MLIVPITSAVNGERHGPPGNEGGAQETWCGGDGGWGVMPQLPQLWWVPHEGDVWEAGARLWLQPWLVSNQQWASRVWSQIILFWHKWRNSDLGSWHRLHNQLSLAIFMPQLNFCNLVLVYPCELFPLLAMSFDQDNTLYTHSLPSVLQLRWCTTLFTFSHPLSG